MGGGGETMSEFGYRYETLKNEFLARGDDLLTAMQRAVAQIQYEVWLTGHTYDCVICQ